MTTMEAIEQTESLALVVPPEPKDALAVFAAKDTKEAERILGMVRAQIDGFIAVRPDVSTKAGRDLIRSFANRVTKSKTAIEAVGADLAKEQKEIPKRIDATRRLFKETLDAWRDEVRQPLTDWENAEEERIARIKDGLAALQGTIDDPQWITRSIEQLRDRLSEVERDADVSEARWDEYASAAAELRTKAIEVLTERIAVREKQEAEQAELARLRAEADERAKKDREEQIAREAAEKARKEAEAKAEADKRAAEQREADLKAAVAKAAEDKRLAEERAVKAAQEAKEQAAREAQAKADAEERERKAREADKAHRASVNRAALEALTVNGISDADAKLVITLIATGQVPNVEIRY
jgi:hypothetical protein